MEALLILPNEHMKCLAKHSVMAVCEQWKISISPDVLSSAQYSKQTTNRKKIDVAVIGCLV